MTMSVLPNDWKDSTFSGQKLSGDGFSVVSYYQACLACGRMLRIAVHNLGETLACGHCRRRFTARDPAAGDAPSEGQGASDLQRADELLRRLNR